MISLLASLLSSSPFRVLFRLASSWVHTLIPLHRLHSGYTTPTYTDKGRFDCFGLFGHVFSSHVGLVDQLAR
jgi:hypothetical protein